MTTFTPQSTPGGSQKEPTNHPKVDFGEGWGPSGAPGGPKWPTRGDLVAIWGTLGLVLGGQGQNGGPKNPKREPGATRNLIKK